MIFAALGTYGEFVCDITERVNWLLPSSPFTLVDLAEQLATGVPFIGESLVLMALKDVSTVLTCVAGYKVLKILPGRF
jgi:hypothetical protein